MSRRIIFRAPDPEAPLVGLDDDAASWARCVLVEFLAGDLDVARLDEELDWYLRGIQPPRSRRLPIV